MHRIGPARVLLMGVICASSTVEAQTQAKTPFGIVDNSFLVEEAFNQEPGVVQNIFSYTREASRQWILSFTQEWPVGSMTHQLSYTLPVGRMGADTGFGDVLLNYRWQALT